MALNGVRGLDLIVADGVSHREIAARAPYDLIIANILAWPLIAMAPRIAAALGPNKMAILRNHGLLTVGTTVDAAAWWFITGERTCQSQLAAMSAGKPVPIDHDHAVLTHGQVGSELAGQFSFHPLYSWIVAEEPDLLD